MGLRENLLTTMASWMENQEETNKLEEEGSDEVIATTFQNARDTVLFWLEDDYQWFLDSYWPEDGEVVDAEEMIGVLRSITASEYGEKMNAWERGNLMQNWVGTGGYRR